VIGVVGVEGVLGGTKQVTDMISKVMVEMEVSHKVYGIDSLSFIQLRKENVDSILVVGGWYYPLWLMEDFILEQAERRLRMVGYLVTEGPIPPNMGRLLDYLDEIIVPSRFVHYWFSQRYHKRLKLVPHGVDVDLFRPEKPNPPERPFDVGVVFPATVGPLRFRKAVDITCKVVSSLRREGVRVAGNRWCHKVVNCDFYNMLTEYSSLPYFYNSVKVFLFPSRSEGFGLPPLEAMSCGVPVVYSNAPAHNEFCVGVPIQTKFDGFRKNWESHVYTCIYESEPDDYVDAILSLLDDEERLDSLGEEARFEAIKYDYRIVYGELLDEVVG